MEKNDINLEEAIKKTLEVTRTEIDPLFDSFGKYAPIYLGTTSNVKETVALYKNVRDALVVGSQGTLTYELVLNGAKNIDCFDCNILQYLFFCLFDAVIKNCSYMDFINNFTTIKDGNTQIISFLLSSDIFYEVLTHMEYPAREYWSYLFMHSLIPKLLSGNLFRTNYSLFADYLEQFSSIYTPDKFYELQDLLNSNDVKIDYHICGIDDIHKEFKGKKYDLLMFDNILEYYTEIPLLSNISDVNRYVKNKLVPMLNENGAIQLSYGFINSADGVKKLKGIENNTGEGISKIMRDRIALEEMKKGFISSMLKKYDEYEYNFVKAVELDKQGDANNVVLTYRKK